MVKRAVATSYDLERHYQQEMAGSHDAVTDASSEAVTEMRQLPPLKCINMATSVAHLKNMTDSYTIHQQRRTILDSSFWLVLKLYHKNTGFSSPFFYHSYRLYYFTCVVHHRGEDYWKFAC